MSARVPDGLEGHPWGAEGGFLGLEGEGASWSGAATVVVPVPYEATTSWGAGTREGPRAILEASRYLERYDTELEAVPADAGVHTLPRLELTADGPRRAVEQLRAAYVDLLEVAGGRFPVLLGGEHTLSSAPVAAWHERLDGDLSVLQLDAHADLRERHHGTRWSHACVMRRIAERTDDVAAVGVRAVTPEEREAMRDHGLVAVFAREMRREGWVEKALAGLGENVYVTVDVDFFDPALVPATGAPVPGGGDWWDALDLLRAVFRERNVVGADVVELAPGSRDRASATVAAKLVYKMMGYRAAG